MLFFAPLSSHFLVFPCIFFAFPRFFFVFFSQYLVFPRIFLVFPRISSYFPRYSATRRASWGGWPQVFIFCLLKKRHFVWRGSWRPPGASPGKAGTLPARNFLVFPCISSHFLVFSSYFPRISTYFHRTSSVFCQDLVFCNKSPVKFYCFFQLKRLSGATRIEQL